jgi:hypothetical protein
MDEEAKEMLDSLLQEKYAIAKTEKDSSAILQFERKFRDSVYIGGGTINDPDPKNGGWKFSTSGPQYASNPEYDSVQKALPAGERDGWIKRKITKRNIYINTKYAGRQNEFWKDTVNRFLHTFPYLLFVSLPLYALFLKFLYTRRKNFYYADHAIFLVHLYIFTFINLLFIFGISKLTNINGLSWLIYLQGALLLYGTGYALTAMKRFYEQGWGKTILKFILFNILCLVTINILFLVFFTFTVYQS